MARMALEKLTPGMRLDKPVINLHGVLLLKEGGTLTAKHLEIFKAWGVREVDVVRADGGQPEEIAATPMPPEVLQAVRDLVAQRFRRANLADSPVMAEIHRVVMQRLAQGLVVQGRA